MSARAHEEAVGLVARGCLPFPLDKTQPTKKQRCDDGGCTSWMDSRSGYGSRTPNPKVSTDHEYNSTHPDQASAGAAPKTASRLYPAGSADERGGGRCLHETREKVKL